MKAFIIQEMSISSSLKNVVGVSGTLTGARKLCDKLYQQKPLHYDNTARDDNNRIPVFYIMEYDGIKWFDATCYNAKTKESDGGLLKKWFWCERCQKLEEK